MQKKVEAPRLRLKRNPAVSTRAYSRQQEKEKTAAVASLQIVTNNFDHYLKTLMVAVPITAILLHAATVKDETVKLFDLTFNRQSAALIITALGCIFLLYCARCLTCCLYAVEHSRTPHDLTNYLQTHPGVMNPFSKRIELPYRAARQDLEDLGEAWQPSVHIRKSSNAERDETAQVVIKAKVDQKQTHSNIIEKTYNFLSPNLGLMLTGFMWIFLLASADKVFNPAGYRSFFTSGGGLEGLVAILSAPIFFAVGLLFYPCLFVFGVVLVRSVKVVCGDDYKMRWAVFGAALGVCLVLSKAVLVFHVRLRQPHLFNMSAL
jgi:hypothetical protein